MSETIIMLLAFVVGAIVGLLALMTGFILVMVAVAYLFRQWLSR